MRLYRWAGGRQTGRVPSLTRSLDAAGKITELLQTAGFTSTRTEILEVDPPVVCVLAANQDPVLGERR